MLVQELKTCIGFKKQSALQTALVAADCWALRQTNEDVPIPVPVNESDRDDIGKGIWPTQNFKSHWTVDFPWNGRLTSERAAQCFAFAFGKATKAAAGTGFKYTCTPLDPDAGDDNAMPSTTFVAAGRQGASAVFDVGIIGVAFEEISLSLRQGVGRDTAQMNAQLLGCGKHAEPSTITIPAFTTEHGLAIGGAAITIHTVDYTTTARLVSLEFRWKNNILRDSGYYAGSGSQSDYAIMGRMRRGKPDIGLSFVVEAVTSGNERSDTLAQTDGAALIVIEGATIGVGPSKHKLSISVPSLLFRTVTPGNNEGTLTWNVECDVLKDAVNPIVTVEATCEQDNILVEAS